MALADQIKQRRIDRHLSKAELARQAHISRGYMSQLEDPTRRIKPSADVLYRIAFALGTSPGDLLEHSPKTQGDDEGLVVIPLGLRQLALEEDLSMAEVHMLAGLHYRGRRPVTKKSWWYILEAIRRSCQEPIG